MSQHRIAADIGGTFTDVACIDGEGFIRTHKLRSTPHAFGAAVVEGIAALRAELGAPPESVSELLHGCTVATNAILEHKGARTALITTAGFRDVLELRRIRVPRLYDPLYVKPAPLVPRELRLELDERIGPDGSVERAPDPAAIKALVERVRRMDVEAVAVCLLHAYANPEHERRMVAALREALPALFVCASHEVLPEMREYERTSTTVINAYVGPPVSRYLAELERDLGAAGTTAPLLIMQSGGGIMPASGVRRLPAGIVECGPAAGVIGAARLGRLAGHEDIITLDMGGTTAKAALIEGGRVTVTDEYEVGGGISSSNRLVNGAGYALKLPVIDISEVGAGGGSIVRVDAAGAIRVGPDSAGADPGPACYGQGIAPTVTDANVVLGYLNPEALAGGSVPIDAERAARAIGDQVAAPLGMELAAAAHGIHVLANAEMMKAIKSVSTYRGRDPRDFVMLAFGGNGGVHGPQLAAALQMRRVLVPPAAGVFSAVGLLLADLQATRTRTWFSPVQALDVAAARQALEALREEALDGLGRRGRGAGVHTLFELAMRYRGQAFELVVPLSGERLDPPTLVATVERFEQEHARTYGHRFDGGGEVELVSLRVTAAIATEAAAPRVRPTTGGRTVASRPVYFGPCTGFVDTPVIDRFELGATFRPGPLVIEEYEGTTVVPPNGRARLDTRQFIEIELEP